MNASQQTAHDDYETCLKCPRSLVCATHKYIIVLVCSVCRAVLAVKWRVGIRDATSYLGDEHIEHIKAWRTCAYVERAARFEDAVMSKTYTLEIPSPLGARFTASYQGTCCACWGTLRQTEAGDE